MFTILIPTDFSENAQNAIDYGISLYGDITTKVLLINTYYIPYAPVDSSVSAKDSLRVEADEKFEKELKRIKQKFSDFRSEIECRFKIGDPVSAACHIEKNESIDMIVMGTKGASGLDEILVGSRASFMVGKANVPILLVPENAKFNQINNILLASDLQTFLKKKELEPLISLSKKFNAKVSILHITDKKEGEKLAGDTLIGSELKYDLQEVKYAFFTVSGKKIPEAIDKFMHEHKADVLVTVTNKGNLFHKVFHKSITKKMAMHTDIPMLVIPHPL